MMLDRFGRRRPIESGLLGHRFGPGIWLIFRFFSEIDCDILGVSVGMHAPFMPHT
jgi:hypothetical protein